MRIILECSIHELPQEEQDKWFEMSHEHEIFCTDADGVLWQVLDLVEVEDED